MKSQTLLAALALVCLTSSAADAPRQIKLGSAAQQTAGCTFEDEKFDLGARVCRNGQFWECAANGEWVNVGIKCNRKR